MNKTIFITGATSGFGKATAEKFAADKDRLIITGRRNERLQEIRESLISRFGVEVLALHFDVRDRKAAEGAIGSLPAEWKQIDILINNAGLAMGRDYFDEGNVDDWDTMIDTNLKGLLYVTRAIVPLMTRRKKGHIINLGSVAARDVYEKGNVYCATKAAVDILSHSMRVDLLRQGIKVTAIHPGAAETEFSLVRFKGNEENAKNIYKGYQPLTAEDVANTIFYCAGLPDHVCINDLVITCLAQADGIHFFKGQ